MWQARNKRISNNQGKTKNTTLRCLVADLLGGVRAKPLFRDSTTMYTWNNTTETTTIVKQLRGSIFRSLQTRATSLFRPCDQSRNVVLGVRPGHAMLMRSITQAFVLCTTLSCSFISPVRPTVYTNPARKQIFLIIMWFFLSAIFSTTDPNLSLRILRPQA